MASGGSTRPSARAGVEQYSLATQSARLTSSGGTPSSSARSGASSFCDATSLLSLMPTTTPSTLRRPKGTTSIEPTSTTPPRSSLGRR